MTRSINTQELNAFLKNKRAVTLIDVRRKSDYDASPQKMTGAQWHDPEKIDTWVKQLPADNFIVAYCVKGGAVSQSVADRLQTNGLNAVFLEGGLNAWIESGPLIEKNAAPK